VVRDLYEAYVAAPSEMPQDFASREDTHRAVADYIAGMTDRYAAREHERLTGRKWFA
jgi:dGTPase